MRVRLYRTGCSHPLTPRWADEGEDAVTPRPPCCEFVLSASGCRCRRPEKKIERAAAVDFEVIVSPFSPRRTFLIHSARLPRRYTPRSFFCFSTVLLTPKTLKRQSQLYHTRQFSPKTGQLVIRFFFSLVDDQTTNKTFEFKVIRTLDLVMSYGRIFTYYIIITIQYSDRWLCEFVRVTRTLVNFIITIKKKIL